MLLAAGNLRENVELRVLGPIELIGDAGPIALPASKPRTLLAALAVHRGSPRDADFLVDALWGEAPPGSAAKLIQVYVSQLRRILPAGITIATQPGGYVLHLAPEQLDAARFETAVSEGRAALRAGNPLLASAVLGRGLALWRGPAYSDVRFRPFAGQAIEELETLRDLALEERLEADLRLGRAPDVLGELRALLAADPTRERIATMAMLAAYRAGAAKDALELFDSHSAALRDELDEEPGPAAVALRERIVQRDPTLDLDRIEATSPPLPRPPSDLVGRERELAELRALLGRPGVRLVSLTGAGGSGKSRLALELALLLRAEHANGAGYVELASLTDEDLVLPTLARAVEVDPGSDAFGALVEWLAPRDLLLIVDNLEHLRGAAPELVRLLAAAPRLVIVVTTRVVLHVSGEHVYPVAPLTELDAAALFTERARAQDPSFALDPGSAPVVAEICRGLDGLPLPIELAAARVRSLGLNAIRDRLTSRLTLLTGGPRDLPARQQTLRETLAWSVNLLDPPAGEVFARLAVFPAGCGMSAARAVAGADDESIGVLVDHNLVQALDVDGGRGYRLLETVREFAYERLGAEREATEARLVDWFASLIEALDLNAAGAQPVALGELDREVDVLRDALRHAGRDADPAKELFIASGVWRFWWIRGYLAEGRAVLDSILARRGLVATPEGARTVRACASITWSMGEPERAEQLATDALALATQAASTTEQIAAHNLLGVVKTARGELAAAEPHHLESIRLADAAGLSGLVQTAKLNRGVALLDGGRLDEARALFQEVLAYREVEGSTEGIGFARLNLGDTEFDAGNLAIAEAHFRAAAEAFRSVGFHTRHGNSLQGLAAVEAATGRHAEAARHLGAAASLLAAAGWSADGTALAPIAEAEARQALGDAAFAQLYMAGMLSAAK